MKIIEKAVHALLKDFAEGRVYPLLADQTAPSPYIVFQRTDSDRWRDVDAPSGMAQAYMQVDVYANGFYEAKELAAAVEKALDGYRGIVYYGDQIDNSMRIGGISLQSDADLLDQTDEPALYRNTMSFLITYEQ